MVICKGGERSSSFSELRGAVTFARSVVTATC